MGECFSQPFVSMHARRHLAAWSATIVGFALVSVIALAEPVSPSTDTPREAVLHFLDRARAHDYDAAAEILRAPGRTVPHATDSARQLQAVLDRFVVIEPASLSDRPEGQLDDGLPPHVEEIARIPTPDGPEPVRLVRLSSGRWVFSRETLARVPRWYALLGHRWLRERLPDVLLRTGPLDLAWWQWVALPVLVVVSVILGRLLGLLLHWVLRSLARRTSTQLDDRLIERLGTPRNLALVSLLALWLLPSLELSARAEAVITKSTSVLLFLAVGWALLRLADVAAEFARTSRFVLQHPVTLGFFPLGTGLVKLTLSLLVLAALLQYLGLPVASVVASLGIGGLAVALAAKPTLENLLGSVTLGMDQPFRPGDLIKVDDILGTVEHIGVRSTRIRTLDRTLVTLPNGKLADMKIETYSARDRMRLHCILGVEYSTTAEQIRAVLQGLESTLRAHPRIWPDDILVFFKEFAASSLNIEVMAWFQTSNWNEFLRIRQEVYLQFMQVVERAGAKFAFPTQTVHLVNSREAESPKHH